VLITTPPDLTIYMAFRKLARLWKIHLSAEGLWLERDVPIAPEFLATEVPAPLVKMFKHARAIVSRIEIVLGNLRIEFIRSGGHPPFPESFFDEIRMHADGDLSLLDADIAEISAQLFTGLHVNAVSATMPFAEIFNVPPSTVSVGNTFLSQSMPRK
jgi:hypothetical protein